MISINKISNQANLSFFNKEEILCFSLLFTIQGSDRADAPSSVVLGKYIPWLQFREINLSSILLKIFIVIIHNCLLKTLVAVCFFKHTLNSKLRSTLQSVENTKERDQDMADGILATGVTEILRRLAMLVTQEIELATSVKVELEKLQSTMSMILSVMTDAERKQSNDASVKLWMKDLKALAYEADDILDEYSYENNQQFEIHRPYNKVCNFCFFGSKFKPTFYSHMAHKIKDINMKFSEISSRRDKLGLVICIGSSSDTMINVVHEGNMNRETYSYVDASKNFGREIDKSKIIDMLRMGGGEAVSVIPIVGMGGLGKTTLAQLVYNDEAVRDHFDMRIWVCATQTFNVKKILISMTESITKSNCQDVSNFDVIVNRLQVCLREKNFLLVLDDVWNKNPEEWDKLKNPLTVGGKKSKIIITTRSNIVASIVVGSEFSPYQLQGLPEDDCWSIFTQKAFGASGGAIETPNLIVIGKELLNRCGGLPLAAKFLGSLLRNKDMKEWLIIRNSEMWDDHCEDESRILPILKLSYDNLPPHLKQCFSYCCIFPKNTEIKRETLIQLWMAEGFLFQSNGTDEMSLEDTGKRYFKNLVNNSFFQDVHDYSETLTCKMHDLVHDLAQSVTGNEECLIVAERSAHNVQYISKARRLQLVNLDGELPVDTLNKLNDAKELRSLFIKGSMNIHSIMANNRRLRVLDLSGTNLEVLPPSIGNLIHLRYLDLSHTNIKMLPESISKLNNLQTFKLVGTKLPTPPKDMHKLNSLKDLQYKSRND